MFVRTVLMIIVILVAFSAIRAFADSIDYSSDGSLKEGTATVKGSASAGMTWSVTDTLTEIDDSTTGQVMQGDLGKVDITSGKLMNCSSGLCFTGGSVDITSTSGQVLLNESFLSGTVTKSGSNTFLNATFANGGTTEIASKNGVFSSNTIVTTVPEPSALWLLGTGLVGLSFVRKWIG